MIENRSTIGPKPCFKAVEDCETLIKAHYIGCRVGQTKVSYFGSECKCSHAQCVDCLADFRPTEVGNLQATLFMPVLHDTAITRRFEPEDGAGLDVSVPSEWIFITMISSMTGRTEERLCNSFIES